MKYLLITCSLVLCNWAYAQYLPTIEENKIWSISGYYIQFDFRNMYDIYIDGEEIYEGQEYKVLKIYSDLFWEKTFGLVREDTISGKVWFRSHLHADFDEYVDTSQEVLIADYSLEPGDQFYYTYFTSYWDDEFFTDSVLFEVEEVGVLSGRKYVQMNSLDEEQQNFLMNYDLFYPFFESPVANQVPLRFIEGVGPSFGFTLQNPYSINDQYPLDPYVLCAHVDGEEVWNDPFVEDCYYEGGLPLITSIENHYYDFDFVAFPNPAKDYITFSYSFFLEQAPNRQLRVFNQNGAVVQTFDLGKAQEGQQLWDTRKVTPGIYLYDVYEGERKVHSGKVVIQ